MAAFGLVWEGEAEQDFEVWPDVWPVLQVFFGCSTQWRLAEGGTPTGLHYEVLPFLMKTAGIKKKDRADMLTDIQACEAAALKCWRARRGH